MRQFLSASSDGCGFGGGVGGFGLLFRFASGLTGGFLRGFYGLRVTVPGILAVGGPLRGFLGQFRDLFAGAVAVVPVSPSFEMYWVNCSILGLKHVPVPYHEDLTISIDEIISAISGDTRIVVLLNPNNSVDNVYTEEELQKVILRTREVGAVLIIDEAYHYF